MLQKAATAEGCWHGVHRRDISRERPRVLLCLSAINLYCSMFFSVNGLDHSRFFVQVSLQLSHAGRFNCHSRNHLKLCPVKHKKNIVPHLSQNRSQDAMKSDFAGWVELTIFFICGIIQGPRIATFSIIQADLNNRRLLLYSAFPAFPQSSHENWCFRCIFLIAMNLWKGRCEAFHMPKILQDIHIL